MPFLPPRLFPRLRRHSRNSARVDRAATAAVDAAVRAQLESLESRRLLANVSWINPLGGDFNDPTNWDTNTVPAAGDDAFITLDGDYTVSISTGGDASVNSLTLGSPVGVQTLAVDGATLATSSAFANDDVVQLTSTATLAVTGGTFAHAAGAGFGGGGRLALSNVTATIDGSLAGVGLTATNSTLGGAGTVTIDSGLSATLFASMVNVPWTSNGTLEVTDDSSLAGGLSTGVGSTLRVRGNATGGAVTLTVANGFTNNGTIELTASDSANAATITLTAGTLTNSASGTISVLAGAGGARTLTTQLDNQGALNVAAATTLARADADHTNAGTISITGGTLSVNQTGSTPSFTNSGTVTINASYGLAVGGGTFSQAGGSIGGSGALSFAGVAADFATNFSNATTALLPVLSTITGAGTITNEVGKTLTLFGTTIAAPLVNNGILDVTEDSAVNGTFTSSGGSTIRVRGNATGGASSVTFANGFVNNGTIELTASDSAQNASIVVTAGTLTNPAGSAINMLAGTGGQRFILAAVNNQGTMTVSAATSVLKADAVHSNSGTLNVTGGNYTVFQSGTSPSFTNTGSIDISASRVLTISAGQFNQSAGAISGSGTLSLLSATANFATNFSNATTAFAVTGSTISGAGTITNAAGKQITLTNTVFNTPFSNESLLLSRGTADAINGTFTSVAGSIIRVQGNSGAAAGTSLTFANGFTSNGLIDLTSTDGAFNATLNVTAGRLTVASGRFVHFSAGTGGSRAFNAQYTNNGVMNVNAPATITKASASQINVGTLNVANADLTVALSGTSPSFSNLGTIYVVNGRTFTLTGANLANAGFVRSGGTVAANVTNTGIVSPERPGNGSTIYYENFNYASGSNLNGQGGWVEPGISDPFSSDFAKPEIVQPNSLAFPNLSTSGRSVQTQGLYSFDSNTFPSFLGANNTYWVGFLIRQDVVGTGGSAGADYGGLALGVGPGIFIGKPGGGAGVNNWSLERGDAAAQSASSVPATLGTTAFLVARIVLNDDGVPGTSGADLDTVTLYVNPAPGTAEGSLVPAASLSMELFDFNNLALSTGANAKWTFDEIRAGTSFSDVAPRAASITTVNGNLTQTTGALAIDIAGATPDTQLDQINVNGAVSLGGSLLLNSTFTPAGAQTFTIINNDGVDAVSGTFSGLAEGATFVGSNGRTYRISYVGGTGNDVTVTYLPGISIADLTISEGTGGTKIANFTVSLSDAGAATSTVQWVTSNGSATSPSDYTAASGTVTFNPFVTSQQVSITLNSDALDENDETFNITLSNPTNAVISDGSAVGTITDDDPPPTISINDVTVMEGDAGTLNAVFTVSLSAVSSKTITVNAATANGTAGAPGDYTTIASQLLTFNPNDLTKTVTVVIASDLLDESDETYFVNLTSPTNATISDNQGLGTITDNDPLPNLSINDVSVSEGDAGTKLATFTISLSAASGRNVTLNYATANNTATAGSDYVALASTPLTFLPGETSKQVSVTINGDLLNEPNETFLLNLSGVTNANVTDSQGQGTITNDDPAVTVAITPIAPDPRTTPVSSVTITFSEAILSGFALADLALTRDGTAVALGGATLTTSDNITWTLASLDALTDRAGSYVLTLSDTGAAITGTHGPITNSPQNDSWKMTAVLGTSGNDDIRLVRNSSTGRADVYVGGVFSYDFDYAALSFVNLLGGDGDDLLTVDTTNGVPLPINVSVMGAADGQIGNDIIRFIGATTGSSHTFTSTLIQSGLTLGYTAETLELQRGTYTATADLANKNLSLIGGAGTNVVFNQTQHLAALSVAAGTNLTVNSGGNKVLVVKSLNLAGLLNLSDNDMVVDYDPLAASPMGSLVGGQYTGIQGLIQTARGDSTWNGTTGLTSTSAIADYTGLGLEEASSALDFGAGGTALFSGETVDATAVLIKFTYVGDMNLDGFISGDDYASIDFNTAVPNAWGYWNGDLNFDGIVSGDDYAAIDFNIVAQGPML